MEPDLAGVVKELAERLKKQDECGARNHPNAVRQHISQFHGPPQAHMYCPDCDLHYDRNLTPEESKEWYRRLDEPMTV
jgi:hypothetical protein